MKSILLAVLLMALVCGCEKSEQEQEKTKEKAKDIQIEVPDNTFTFVDSAGKTYKVPLLEEVPKCEYDYSRLVEQNGYKYYKDSAGNIDSKIGIDVSKYQEEIDWKKVKNSGMDFAVIRLGYRGYSEGRLKEDEYFRQNMEGAKDAGLDVGVYFLSQALSEEEALEEAQFVLECIEDYELAYPVVFDTEEIPDEDARTKDLDKEQYTKNCITFCDAIREKGKETMIYSNMNWMAFTLDLTKLIDYDFWYADYEPTPQCPYIFKMWQYTEKGKVPGVEGDVDINIWFE